MGLHHGISDHKRNNRKIKEGGTTLQQGIVLPVEHDTNPNLVYVHFGDKTTVPTERIDGGVWCHNALNSFVRYRDIMDKPVSYGSYTPLLPYTPVMVLTAEGGAGISMIIGFAPTNTNTPDPENRNELNVIAQSPKGSLIAIDDKTGNIQMLYDKGNTSLVMGNQAIALEISKGEKSGKTGDTGLFINKESFEFRLRDSLMKFDESGFSIGFDDGGSYMKITKKGVEFHGEEFSKLTSKEQVSLKGSKLTLQGTKDASLSGAQVKVGGKQLTNITGTQIDIRSTYTVQLTGIHVGLRALGMIRMISPIRESVHPAMDTKAVGIDATVCATNSSLIAPTVAVGASTIVRDGILISNTGLGASSASAVTSGTMAAAEGLHTSFMTAFTALLMKVAPVTAANKIIADLIAGTSEPAMEPSGSVTNAKDKKDTKTYGTVTASKFIAKNTVMEKYSIVPNLVSKSSTALMNSKVSKATGVGMGQQVQPRIINTSKPQGGMPKLNKFLKG